MTDGYQVYDQIAEKHQYVHLRCWAHCWRNIVEAVYVPPKKARTPEQPAVQFVDLIGQLYAVKKRARDHKLSAADRLIERQRHSMPVLDRIQVPFLTHLRAVVPGSLPGKTLHYLSAQGGPSSPVS